MELLLVPGIMVVLDQQLPDTSIDADGFLQVLHPAVCDEIFAKVQHTQRTIVVAQSPGDCRRTLVGNDVALEIEAGDGRVGSQRLANSAGALVTDLASLRIHAQHMRAIRR